MPAAKNLLGAQFGNLVVIRKGQREIYGGKPRQNWICYCELCGAEEEFRPVNLIPTDSPNDRKLRYTACRECSQKTCEICGDLFPVNHPSVICKKAGCLKTYSQEYQKAHYEKRKPRLQTPEARAVHNAREKSRYAALPPEAKALIAQAKRQRTLAMTPAQRVEKRRKNREWYARFRESQPSRYDALWERRRAYMALVAADPDRADKMREYNRLWRREWIAELRKTPELYEMYLERTRRYGRAWYERTANDPEAWSVYKRAVRARVAQAAREQMFREGMEIINYAERSKPTG